MAFSLLRQSKVPLLAGPSTIMSVIDANADFTGAVASTLTGHAALLAVMAATGIILCLAVVAEVWLNKKIDSVFSRITAIILAGLSLPYISSTESPLLVLSRCRG